MYRQEILKDIRLFISRPVTKFYDSLFLRLDLSFVQEPSLEAGLDEEITHTKESLSVLGERIATCGSKKIQDLTERIWRLLGTDKIREIRSKDGEDARFGHKAPTGTFCGYGSHPAVAEGRLVAGISITPRGEPDGQQLPGLIEKAQKNGIEVMEVIEDMTYVSEDNVDAYGEKIALIAKIDPAAAAAAEAKLKKGFSFNRDAEMLQCLAGELTTRVEKREIKDGNQYRNYAFGKKRCGKCPLEGQCKVGEWKTHNYSIIQAKGKNRSRLEFEAGEEFQERLKIRHRIEEKNGELKEAHGSGRADSVGLFTMELRMNFTAFVTNIKRITKLIALTG